MTHANRVVLFGMGLIFAFLTPGFAGLAYIYFRAAITGLWPHIGALK